MLRFLLLLTITSFASAAELRIGLIGTDTSHAIAFAKALNHPDRPEYVAGGKIVGAFKGGSPDVQSSASRVEGFAAELKKDHGVVFYDSIAELLKHVDAVMILSVDGRTHLPQAKQVFPSGKPVFIDKPFAGTLRDALEIAQLGRTTNTRWFSSSSLRQSTRVALKGANYGELRGAFAFSPAELEPHHPDLFWYGIHGVESLYTVMGRGCISVQRAHAPNADVVTGTWPEGRVGTMRGLRGGKSGYGLTVFGSTANVSPELKVNYRPLVEDILAFFAGGPAPVTNDETVEIMAFMEAADESKRRGGAPVTLADVMKANQ